VRNSGGGVGPGQLQHPAEVVQDSGLLGPIAKLAEDLQGLAAASAGRCVVACRCVQGAPAKRHDLEAVCPRQHPFRV